ncbi:MAG: phosphoglucosamine mutase, partial [bacterium]
HLAPPSEIGRRINFAEGAESYKNFLLGKATRSFKGLRIVIDSANGAGYELAPLLFSELDANVILLNGKPNGRNINEGCGAVHPQEMARKVIESGAHLGFSLDGDGDRVIFSDEKGEIIQGDGALCILATYMKDKGILKGPVVTTHMTNRGIELALRERGIDVVRVQIGDKYVADKMKEIGANLGGEQSGHIILFDHLPTGDGLLTAIKLIEIMLEKGKPLSELRNYKIFPQKLVNISTKEAKKWEKDESVREIVEKARISSGGKVRILVRASGTENKLRIMVEGEEEKVVEELTFYLLENIKKVIGENDGYLLSS